MSVARQSVPNSSRTAEWIFMKFNVRKFNLPLLDKWTPYVHFCAHLDYSSLNIY